MRKNNITLAAILGLAILFTPAAFADTAAQLRTTIINYGRGGGSGGTALSATVNGNTVTVTGNVTNATATLTLNIDADVTVVWRATLGTMTTNLENLKMVTLNGGTGTFNMESGTISATAANAIYNQTDNTVNISGGTVSATTGYAVVNYSTGTVNISGGTVSAIGNGYAVYNSSTGTVNISGGTVSATTSSTVFNNYGKITVSGNAMVTSASTSTTSGTIHLASGGTATAERLVITGGTVENTAVGSNVNAVYNNSTGAVTISGGKVSATTGTAVYNYGSGKVTVSGDAIITSENAIATSGTICTAGVGGIVEITGGTVENTAASGNAVCNYSAVSISGGKVLAKEGKAIYIVEGTTTLTGGLLFAYGENVSDVIYGTYDSPSGNHAIVAWNKAEGNTEYDAFADDDIASLPETAKWLNNNGKAGIGYANGSNTGFIELPVTVNKIEPAVTFPTTYSISYSPSKNLSQVDFVGGTGNGTFAWENGTVVPTVGNSGYNVVFTPTDAENYLNLTEVVALTVNKATQQTPTGLTATYGQTLANVALPTGWAWESALTTPVGNVGMQPHMASYTPTDINNDNALTGISVNVNVAKANYDMSGIVLMDATVTYNGQPHSIFVSGTLPTGLTVAYTGNTQTTLGAHTVTASFTGDANHNTPAPMTATLTIVSAPTYKVTVVSGIGSSSYEAGEEVEITANIPPAGKAFDKWTTADGVTFTNGNAESTTFTMPAKNVTVTATYRDLPPGEYAITVENNGHGIANASANSATAGTEITLTVMPNEGYVFKEWEVVSGGVTIANNKFTMPAGNVVVMAIFESEGTDPVRTPQIASSNIHAYAIGNSIVLQNLPANAKVEVFGLNGKLITTSHSPLATSHLGVQTIEVHAKGIYILSKSPAVAYRLMCCVWR